ncbi:hypothetical protein DKS56_07850 [Salmonella enterica subsp. enterica serovar Adelaide]|nr:hypothetical protein [Salmonella enterica]EBU6735968.1 hypothetical protein [Salmonella enterica subsp. enterica serovar Adelaide]ECE6540365.1 hypothetical protein [Salmonella enterica subsp. enterica]ECS7525582.1 hypothetical protein [Salmonella enterica]ECU7993390.1 hypothetical protein [Salmonella enterica subsp. enterica serovar Toucra]
MVAVTKTMPKQAITIIAIASMSRLFKSYIIKPRKMFSITQRRKYYKPKQHQRRGKRKHCIIGYAF